MLCCPKEIGDDLHERVDEVAHDNPWGHDLGVGILLLVQVPCASHSEELAVVSCAV